MHPAPPQAIVFDLDDTLYPERQYVRSGYLAVAKHLKQTTGCKEDIAQWLWDRFLSGQAAGAFDALNEHFRLRLSAGEISRLITLYREHRPCIKLRDGIQDLMKALTDNHKTLGIVSDGFLPAQRYKFEALGIERFFPTHHIIFTEELGQNREFWKPSPKGFELLAQRMNAPHASCCYVGDNPSKDFVAPNGLGWQTVQLLLEDQVHSHKPAPPQGQPQHVVHSVQELQRFLLSR